MQDIVKTENLKFIYGADENENKEQALKNVNLNIFKGEFLGILGRNGSGKSTLAKIINALLIPTEGVCYVGNYNTSDENNRWEIRKMCGMVFQNPDNQIIGTSVEEDVAFGLENIGIPTEEMIIRIRDAMKCVGIYDNKEKAPHLLSGGQKQRVAIAGILAMKPECIILDEATAMLDPLGRKEVMTVVKQLNKEFNITIIHITHHMDEAVMCDRVVVVDAGKIILEGKPNEIFQNVGKMKEIGLDVPQVTELVYKLNQNGFNMNTDILTVDEAIKELSKYII